MNNGGRISYSLWITHTKSALWGWRVWLCSAFMNVFFHRMEASPPTIVRQNLGRCGKFSRWDRTFNSLSYSPVPDIRVFLLSGIPYCFFQFFADCCLRLSDIGRDTTHIYCAGSFTLTNVKVLSLHSVFLQASFKWQTIVDERWNGCERGARPHWQRIRSWRGQRQYWDWAQL